MQAPKRKRDEISGGSTKFSFMYLPLEIRTRVYEYCYLPRPGHLSRHDNLGQAYNKLSNLKVVSSKSRERAFFQNSRCNHPYLHQSLLFVCRQSHADVWPFYVACHSLAFTRPIKFANDYLAYHPPHRLALIKHLSLRAGDPERIYKPASRSSMKEMVSDFERMVDHYPDVFYNLESFTWELCDKRYWCGTRQDNEEMMRKVILKKLVEHHKQERKQSGLDEVEPVPNSMTPPKHWRAGLVARHRTLKIDEAIVTQHEYSSMLFFERVPEIPSEYRHPLRYIDVIRWLYEPLLGVTSWGGQKVRSITAVLPERTNHWVDHRSLYTQNILWGSGETDFKPGFDILMHTSLVDVGGRIV